MALRPPKRTRFRTRLVVSILIATLPLTALATYALTRRTTRDQRAAADRLVLARTLHVAADFETFVNERRASISVLASIASAAPPTFDLTPLLGYTLGADHAFSQIETTDLLGKPIWWTRGTKAISLPTTSDWFRQAASGQASGSGVFADPESALHWTFLQPIIGSDGRPSGVVAGDVKVSSLAPILGQAELTRSAELLIVDAQEHVVLTSQSGSTVGDAGARRSGSLVASAASPAAQRALAGQQGTIHERDQLGRRVFAGYSPLPDMHWGAVVTEPEAEALAAAHHQARLAAALLLLEALAVIVLASAIAAFARRRLRELVRPGLDASREINADAAQLAAASAELATASSQQSDATAQTSAAVEDLARSVASITSTVDLVATQMRTPQTTLAEAGSVIERSKEYTIVLVERLKEIGALATLINDLADQGNLLALNAAIEAARTGDNGRGFTVIADEVRRLAERSKDSAADIAGILETANTEANVTVASMEKGAEHVRSAHDLMDQVTQTAHQLQLSTEQLRSASEQLVEKMAGSTEAGRRGADTAHEIAGHATTLARLATDLQIVSTSAHDSL